MRLFLLTLLAATPLCAQGTKADYDRALSLGKRTDNKVFRAKVEPHWLPDGNSFWYRVETAPGKSEKVLVDCLKGERQPGYQPTSDADGPAQMLDKPRPSKSGGGETQLTFINKTAADAICWWINTDGGRKKFATIKPGERFEQHTYSGHVWAVETPGGESLGIFEAQDGGGEAIIDGKPRPKAAEIPREPRADSKSPFRAFIRDHNIWLRHRETKEEFQLSQDGKADDRYREPVLISPDGTRVVALQQIPAQEHTVYTIESTPKDQVQPKLHQQNYLKPGDRIAKERPRMFDLAKREPIAIDDALCKNPWDISELRWAPDSSQFTFLYNQRGHQVLRMVAVDAAKGATRTLVEETSPTFVDYSQKTWLRWIEPTGELLWASERDGWNHLYRFDAKTGSLKNQITKGDWVVRSVERVDETKRQLWLKVAGLKPGQDPYYSHAARVNFDGTGFTLLTEGDGTHSWQISPNGRWLIDTYSRVDLPPVVELRDAETGKASCAMEKADASALTTAGWSVPERFAAKGRDGKTDIHGVIYRPSNFDPTKKYPVVEEIYAGPHGFFVPKEWGRQIRQHAIAELGFIVVQIDGMGTNWRNRAFHDIAWRNLKDAGFPDRIAWLKTAATTRPWMDLNRVGIYGGSAGGQNALAGLLHFGDFYKVGIADCGCHDNRMDKIWWNEAWLGEVGPWYEENSNVVHADKLTGKLLLIVGELDTNVDPASTMQVTAALQKANKDYDLCIVTGANHGAAETPYGSRRRMDFLVRHLLGVEPRAQ
jgi:dipeptidyl-peptidase 4